MVEGFQDKELMKVELHRLLKLLAQVEAGIFKKKKKMFLPKTGRQMGTNYIIKSNENSKSCTFAYRL